MVTFDGLPANVVDNAPNRLTVIIPAHAEGAVSVRVANPDLRTSELPASYVTDTGPVPIGFRYSASVPAPPPPGGNAPVAVDDTETTDEDTAVDLDVVTNDTDADTPNGGLHVASISNVHGGTAVLQADGRTVRFTPAADGNDGTTPGGFGFSYTVNDGSLDSAPANVTITVNEVNDAPVAVNDNKTTNEDTAVDIDVITNDADVDTLNSALHVASIGNVHGGTAVLQADGRTVRFTPAADANTGNTPGGFGFSYSVNDGGLDSASPGNVTITVNAVSDAPVAQNDNATTNENTAVDIDVITNDTDTDTLNSGLHVASISNVHGGTALLQADGRTVRFTPATDANTGNTPGGFGFSYIVNDGSLDSTSPANVTIVVSAVDDPPTPVLEDPGPQENDEGDDVRLQLETTLPRHDGSGAHRLFVASGLPRGLHINRRSGLIHGHLGKRSAGLYEVEVKVMLGSASAMVKFTWTVIDTNRAPKIKQQKNQKNFEHDSVSLHLYASDPDRDLLLYSATGLPPGLRINRHTGEIEGHLPPNRSAGSYTVVVTVSDGSMSVTTTFAWVVEAQPKKKADKKH